MSGSALILIAAGESRRMGRPKALLELGGRPFVTRILEAAAAAGLRPLRVVVGAPGPKATIASVVGARAQIVDNAAWETGMLTSFQAGLATLDDALLSGAILWPVDHPAVSASTVRALLACGDRPARPTFRGRPGHPLWLPRRLHAAALALSPPDSMRTLLARHAPEIAALAVDDPGTVMDVDTPADYAALLTARPTWRHQW